MAKIILLLVVSAIVESVGIALLSGGLKTISVPDRLTAAALARVIGQGATNPKLILGVALEAVFFGILLYMLSQRDVSFIWPLTSLGFVFTTLAAAFLLNEKVSLLRWVGVLLITVGAGLTGYSEAAKSHPATAPPGPASASLGPQ
jgi:uncharacterized membrane protein